MAGVMQGQNHCAQCIKALDDKFIIHSHNGVRYCLCDFVCKKKWEKAHDRYKGVHITIDNMLGHGIKNECHECFAIKDINFYWYVIQHNKLYYKFCRTACGDEWDKKHSKYRRTV